MFKQSNRLFNGIAIAFDRGMTFFSSRLAFTIATCCALASPALAESDVTPEVVNRTDSDRFSTQHPWSVSLHTGVATPYGELGLEVEHTISPLFAIAIGGGQGLYDQQFAASLRLRKVYNNSAVGLSVGPGFGDSENLSLSGEQVRSYEHVLWLNGEVYVEYRTSSRLLFRIYGGATTTLLSDCDDRRAQSDLSSCTAEPTLSHPVLGLAVGYAF